MARERPLFRRQVVAYGVGLALVVCGIYCFRDAFERRGAKAPWLLKAVTPGM